MPVVKVEDKLLKFPDNMGQDEIAGVLKNNPPEAVGTQQAGFTEPMGLEKFFPKDKLQEFIEWGRSEEGIKQLIEAGLDIATPIAGVTRALGLANKLFHGGTRLDQATIDFNKLGAGLGEKYPGGIGPLGLSFYGASSEKLAERYVKYGPEGNRGVTQFDVSPDATFIPKGSVWHKFDPEYIEKLRPKMRAVEKEMQEAGFSHKYITDALAFTRDRRSQEKLREILVRNGIDGIVDDLGELGLEVGIFNPKVLSNPKFKGEAK